MRHTSKDYKKLIEYTNLLCQHYNATFTLLHVLSKDLETEEVNTIREISNNKLSGTVGSVLIKQSNNPIDIVSNLTKTS